ncbi:hypothetical protein [Dolichospermum compactum]|uniref:hypothetical protein n=1 Tax=Dolichospermum compactum TaxID=136073 RepID=UPI0012FD4908|nr:hypothetical protein [Dolichospermum compactum]
MNLSISSAFDSGCYSLGYTEELILALDKFAAGTEAIAHTLAEIGKTGATTIIGGG